MQKNQNRRRAVDVTDPPKTLLDRVKVISIGPFDLTPIQRAEKALEELSVEFDGWLKEEVDVLTKARDDVRAQGLSEDTHKELFRAAHDLKGQGETYGYPLITRVCATLCKLLESATQPHLIPLEVIDHHVDAVRNIMIKEIKTADHPLALAIDNKLHDVVMEFVEREDEKRKLSQEQATHSD